MTRRDCGLALLSLVLGPACRGKDGPEEPVWGKQACAHCAMVVGDKRYAAQVLAEDGTRSHFDDIGCMVRFVAERHVRPSHAWVRAESRDAWLDAATARYHGGARTPMDFGFAADEHGDVAFADMQAAVLTRGRMGRDHDAR